MWTRDSDVLSLVIIEWSCKYFYTCTFTGMQNHWKWVTSGGSSITNPLSSYKWGGACKEGGSHLLPSVAFLGALYFSFPGLPQQRTTNWVVLTAQIQCLTSWRLEVWGQGGGKVGSFGGFKGGSTAGLSLWLGDAVFSLCFFTSTSLVQGLCQKFPFL